MANKYNSLTELFTGIANAIRAKKNSTESIVADNFVDEIENLQTGYEQGHKDGYELGLQKGQDEGLSDTLKWLLPRVVQDTLQRQDDHFFEEAGFSGDDLFNSYGNLEASSPWRKANLSLLENHLKFKHVDSRQDRFLVVTLDNYNPYLYISFYFKTFETVDEPDIMTYTRAHRITVPPLSSKTLYYTDGDGHLDWGVGKVGYELSFLPE